MLIAVGSKCVLLADLLRGGLNYILVGSKFALLGAS